MPSLKLHGYISLRWHRTYFHSFHYEVKKMPKVIKSDLIFPFPTKVKTNSIRKWTGLQGQLKPQVSEAPPPRTILQRHRGQPCWPDTCSRDSTGPLCPDPGDETENPAGDSVFISFSSACSIRRKLPVRRESELCSHCRQ